MDIRNFLALCMAGIFVFPASRLRADQLQMQNGDRYAGKIVSVTSNVVVLQSEVLGRIALPREKVSALTFGSGITTNATPMVVTAPTSPATSPRVATTNMDLSAAFQDLGANTNFIQQVRQQMLAGADPAASQKYDELVSGLMGGRLSIDDLRDQAKVSINQINDLKRELGPEAGDALDSYLSILQSFVNETAPATPVVPPASAPAAARPSGLAPVPQNK